MPEKYFIGIEECAEHLGVVEGTFYSWTLSKKMPYIKMGRFVKLHLQELEGWIKKNRVKVYEYKSVEL